MVFFLFRVGFSKPDAELVVFAVITESDALGHSWSFFSVVLPSQNHQLVSQIHELRYP
jgi:hypothetical protein